MSLAAIGVLSGYLSEYGIGLSRTLATTSAKFEWTYSDFEKDREKAAPRLAKPASDKPIGLQRILSGPRRVGVRPLPRYDAAAGMFGAFALRR